VRSCVNHLLSIKPLYLFSEMASGGGKGRIPWTQLLKAQGDYILDEYLPAGITMMQNHHLRLSDANTLLKHWTTRQEAGQIAFRFKSVIKTSRQSKPASTVGGVSAPRKREKILDGLKRHRNREVTVIPREIVRAQMTMMPKQGVILLKIQAQAW
jgi:hypothetical protein